MTLKSSEITLDKLIMMILGGSCTVIIAATSYFMQDMVQTMKALQTDVSAIKTEMSFSRQEIRSLQQDNDEIRKIFYDHVMKKD